MQARQSRLIRTFSDLRNSWGRNSGRRGASNTRGRAMAGSGSAPTAWMNSTAYSVISSTFLEGASLRLYNRARLSRVALTSCRISKSEAPPGRRMGPESVNLTVRKSRRAHEQRFRHPAPGQPHPARADRRGRRGGAGVSAGLGTLCVRLGAGRGGHGRGCQFVYDVQGLAAGTHATAGARTAVPWAVG